MSRIITIYCEGKKGSHDFDILSKIIGSLSFSASILLEPIGSKLGAGSVIDYKQRNSDVVKPYAYFFFRDRDFDFPKPETPSLGRDERRAYLCYGYRITIENYLLDPSAFWNFIQTKPELMRQYNLQTIEDIQTVFIEAAQQIRAYQIVRQVMGKMRVDTNFDTKLTEKSGVLPNDLNEESCKEAAISRILHAKQRTDAWTRKQFELEYAHFSACFDATFMQNFGFLVEFQGKDLETAIRRRLQEFPMKEFYTYAKTNFNYHHYPDLVAFFDLIQTKLTEP